MTREAFQNMILMERELDLYNRMKIGARWRQFLYVLRSVSKREFIENRIKQLLFSTMKPDFYDQMKTGARWRQFLYMW